MIRHSVTRTAVLFLLVAGIAAAALAQSPASIAITRNGADALSITAADLAAMPRAKVTTANNGIETVYEGVWLSEVLKKAGVQFGAGMRGPALASYVLASASDGYQVLFSMGELDPDTTDGQYLLADKADGKPLFGENGSFRLVVPKDKRGARSVRLLTKLDIVQLRK